MHIQKKIQVWLFDPKSQKILLLHTIIQRGAFWQPVTGKVEESENLKQAALREVQEETGFSGNESALLDLEYGFEYEKNQKRFQETCFALPCSSELSVQLEPKEHQAFLWGDFQKGFEVLTFPVHQTSLKKLMSFLKN